MPERGIHTLEHLFAGFMRNHLNGNGVEIIDISPMGCRTGFYMSLIGAPDEQRVADAWKAAMEDVLKVQDQNQIPELNVYQCGTYQMHSLQEAQNMRVAFWNVTYASTATEEASAAEREVAGTAHLVSLDEEAGPGKTPPGFCTCQLPDTPRYALHQVEELPALRPSALRPLQELHTHAWHFAASIVPTALPDR